MPPSESDDAPEAASLPDLDTASDVPETPEAEGDVDGPRAQELDTGEDDPAPEPESTPDEAAEAAEAADAADATEATPDADPAADADRVATQRATGATGSGVPDAVWTYAAPYEPSPQALASSAASLPPGLPGSPPDPRGTQPVYATTFLPSNIPSTAELRVPSSTNEVREFIRQAALDRGIDPDVAVRVALSEGGLTPVTWTGDHASSFGPYQLHYGGMAAGTNAVPGLGDTFTAETGLRANDPRTWRQQVEWTLDRAAGSGWSPWHGAAAAGINAFDGLSDPRNAGGQSASVRRHVDVPNQFAAQLPASEAYAACGPVAAVAVARWLGRNPTVVEAVATAKRTGWTVAGGMNGISNEKRLLDAMRIPAHLETSLDWHHVQRDASSGNPVIVSTPQHYWVIDGYDPAGGKYHVGRSGLAYRGGGEWMTAAQIQQFGGPPNGALYVDNPLVAPPSIAASPATADVSFDRWWEAERA